MSDAQILTAILTHTIEGEWLLLPPTTCGRVPTGRGTPHCYVCVSRGGRPVMRADVYSDPTSHCFREACLLRGDLLFVSIGHHFFSASVTTGKVAVIDLDCYFGYFYEVPEGVLVASGASLYLVSDTGAVLWVSASVGVDGVKVSAVIDGVISGEAEQDPPDGWRPFRVSLATGNTLP